MKKLPPLQNSIKELKEKRKIIDLIFLIDNCKYLKGFPTGTGRIYN